MSTYIDLIVKKRDGHEFSREEIGRLVSGISARHVPDHQIGALLMAIYLNGLTPRETSDLTTAMVASGDTVDLSAIDGFKADKHSTGGVGDKVTLILGPLVAAAGIKFPKLSGRGLAHTGGTLDKLESIPGMRVDLTLDEFIDQVAQIGLAVTGQTKDLVPADGIIYGIRDQTGTVDSIPLIASSVMSKKLAAGADGIVLDVKCGRGAFMKSVEDATTLAQQMVDIGEAAGKRTRALVTSMDVPLGLAIGNALEVREAIVTLQGRGPSDLEDEVVALASEILQMAHLAEGEPADSNTSTYLRRLLRDGSGLEKLRAMIRFQGGDESVVDDPSRLPSTARVELVGASRTGYVMSIDALAIGEIAMDLGAGRRFKDESVSASAGVILRRKPGDRVDVGEPILELHIPDEWDERAPLSVLVERAVQAYRFGKQPPLESPSILATVAGSVQ